MKEGEKKELYSKIEERVLEIVNKYMIEVEGIYLIGSYARGEHEKDSDIDVLVITEETNNKITAGKYSIKLVSLPKVLKLLRTKPLKIYTMLCEAKPLMNYHLITHLRHKKVLKKHILSYVPELKSLIRSNSPFVVTSKKDSAAALDFMMKRLREIFFMVDMLDTKLVYSRVEFIKWLRKESDFSREDFKIIIDAFYKTKRNKLPEKMINQEVIDKLYNFLEYEVGKYHQLRKKYSKSKARISIVH